MTIKGRLDKLSAATPPPARCTPHGPEWIDRADALLRATPDAEADRILDEMLKGCGSALTRAFEDAASRGVTPAAWKESAPWA